MKTFIIILLVYILTIFISRYINKILYKQFNYGVIDTAWFIPVINIIGLILLLISEIYDKYKLTKYFKNNWFTGKYWKRK